MLAPEALPTGAPCWLLAEINFQLVTDLKLGEACHAEKLQAACADTVTQTDER
jgi:hypothetical protein